MSGESNTTSQRVVVIQQESKMLHPNHESNHGESFKTFRVLLFLVLLMQPFGGAVSTPIIEVASNNNGSAVLQSDVYTVQSSLDWIWIIGIPLQIAAFVFILLLCYHTITDSIKRKREATIEYFKNLVKKDKNTIKADSPESSTLTGQKEQLGE